MKIVIFGLTLSSSWGNRQADAWRGLAHALAQRGHKIVFYERDLSVFASHRDLGDWNDGQLWMFTSWDKIRFRARRDLADADVAIVTSACPDAAAATALMVDSPVPMRVFHDFDSAATLDYEASDLPVMYAPPERLDMFDLVLSSNGGSALEELRKHLHATRVAALYAGLDPAQCEVTANRRVAGALSHLADLAVHDELSFDRLFLEPARRLPESLFRLGGVALPSGIAPTPNVLHQQLLGTARRLAFFRSSRLLLDLPGRSNLRMGFCPTEQLLQAAALGGAVITQSWEGLNLFFEPGSEILLADSADDVLAAIERPDAELRQIADRARERVLDEHTFGHRALHFEALIENTARAADEQVLQSVRETSFAQQGPG